MRDTRVAVAVAAVVTCLGAAAPAQANFVGSGADPAGDATDGNPGRDIVAVALEYDRGTGHIKGGVRLAGTPSGDAPANLTLFAGRRTASGCNGYPAVGFGTQTDLRGANWVRLDAPQSPPAATGSAEKLYDEAIEEYEATADELAGQRPDCIVAQLNDPADPNVVFDVAGPLELRALPELEAELGSVPAIFQKGQARTVRLTLRNTGDATTGRVALTVAGARGLDVQMPRRVAPLAAGARRTVDVKVTLSARAQKLTDLRVTAKTAVGPSASVEDSLYLSQRSGGGGGTGSGDDGAKLCYKYTWLPPYSELVLC